MAVALLQQEHVNDNAGTDCTGTVAAISAGSDRLVLVVGMFVGTNSAATVTTATLGAATITPILTLNESGWNPNICLFFGYIKDADIPSGSNTLTLSWSGTGTVADAYVTVFTGVDQTNPIVSFYGDGASTTDPNAIALGPVPAGGAVFCVGGESDTGTALTLPSGYSATSTTNLANASAQAEMAYRLVSTAGTETPAFSGWSATRRGQAGVALRPTGAALSFFDSFNRADGALGSNWTSRNGSMDIVSNQYADTTGGNSNCWSEVATGTVTFSADQEAQVTVSVAASNDYVGPAVRSTASGCYALNVDTAAGSNRRIVRMDGTTKTVIGTVNIQVTSGDTLKLRAVGSTLTAFKNGAQVDQVTDTTYSTGQPGVFYHRGNVSASRGDDFYAVNYVTPSSDLGTATGAPRATVRVAGLSSANTKYTGIVTPGSGIGYIAADPALVNGDVVEYDRTVSGYEVTIANDGSWSIAGSPPDGWYNFQFRVIDDVVGPWAPQSVRVLTPVDVTDVNTDERLYNGGPFTITGTGFGFNQGTVYINAVAQTVTSWSDTTITGTVTGMTTPGTYTLAVVADPGPKFREDFEAYADVAAAVTGPWDSQDTANSGSHSIVTYDGTKAYACTWSLNESRTVLYYRFPGAVNGDDSTGKRYVKVEWDETRDSNWDFQADKSLRLVGRLANGNVSLDIALGLEGTGTPGDSTRAVVFGQGLGTGGNFVIDTDWNMQRNVRYRIGVEVYLNTVGSSDGWIKLWRDGVLMGSASGLNLRSGANTYTFHQVGIGGWESGGAPVSAETRYLDNVEIRWAS